MHWRSWTPLTQTERMAWTRIGRSASRVHDMVYQRTNGRIGHRIPGSHRLLMHTVGAKTGLARTTSLSYATTVMTTSS